MFVAEMECRGKQEWPELVGSNAEDAKEVIESENMYVIGIILPKGTIVTTDYNCRRVWIFVESDTANVAYVPKVG
uniref:Uncharacterized protein n=1 Tax=Picea sitchensis TaxID=3332 RepID=B8LPM1_PICSI|nr:unknown [Picea sitchensis]